jgi:hypothetical protein
MSEIDAYRDHDDSGLAPYRCRVDGKLLRTMKKGTVAKFRSLRAACAAGKAFVEYRSPHPSHPLQRTPVKSYRLILEVTKTEAMHVRVEAPNLLAAKAEVMKLKDNLGYGAWRPITSTARVVKESR